MSLTKSKRRCVPLMKLVTMRPLPLALSRLVTAPDSTRSTTRSENISVWMPRSRLSCRRVSTASGMPPMPICRVEPSSTRPATISPMRASTGVSGSEWCSSRARSVAMKAWMFARGRTLLPWVRGICSLISAMTIRAVVAAALAASHDVPSEHMPWRSGGETCSTATSSGTLPLRKRPGMSERKIGTKSARPSATAARSGEPVKRDTERNSWPRSGAANGAGPEVCRW